MQVKWLRKALQNLNDEAEYIAQENPAAAATMFSYVTARVAALSDLPASGRPGRVPGTRELVIDRYPYVIPYRVVGDEVQVLRVFHTRQKPPSRW